MARHFTLARSPNSAPLPPPPRRTARPPAPRALPRLGPRSGRRPSGGHLSPRGRLVLAICSQLAHVLGLHQDPLFNVRLTVCGSRWLASRARSTVAWRTSLAPLGLSSITRRERPERSLRSLPSPTGAQEMRPRRPPSTASAGASGAAVGGVAAAAAPAARATSTRVTRTRAARSEPRWRPKWSLPAPLPPRPPLSWPSLSRATSGDGHGGVGSRYGSGSVRIVCVGTDVARVFVQLVCCLDGRMARWSVYPTLGQSSR